MAGTEGASLNNPPKLSSKEGEKEFAQGTRWTDSVLDEFIVVGTKPGFVQLINIMNWNTGARSASRETGKLFTDPLSKEDLEKIADEKFGAQWLPVEALKELRQVPAVRGDMSTGEFPATPASGLTWDAQDMLRKAAERLASQEKKAPAKELESDDGISEAMRDMYRPNNRINWSGSEFVVLRHPNEKGVTMLANKVIWDAPNGIKETTGKEFGETLTQAELDAFAPRGFSVNLENIGEDAVLLPRASVVPEAEGLNNADERVAEESANAEPKEEKGSKRRGKRSVAGKNGASDAELVERVDSTSAPQPAPEEVWRPLLVPDSFGRKEVGEYFDSLMRDMQPVLANASPARKLRTVIAVQGFRQAVLTLADALPLAQDPEHQEEIMTRMKKIRIEAEELFKELERDPEGTGGPENAALRGRIQALEQEVANLRSPQTPAEVSVPVAQEGSTQVEPMPQTSEALSPVSEGAPAPIDLGTLIANKSPEAAVNAVNADVERFYQEWNERQQLGNVFRDPSVRMLLDARYHAASLIDEWEGAQGPAKDAKFAELQAFIGQLNGPIAGTVDTAIRKNHSKLKRLYPEIYANQKHEEQHTHNVHAAPQHEEEDHSTYKGSSGWKRLRGAVMAAGVTVLALVGLNEGMKAPPQKGPEVAAAAKTGAGKEGKKRTAIAKAEKREGSKALYEIEVGPNEGADHLFWNLYKNLVETGAGKDLPTVKTFLTGGKTWRQWSETFGFTDREKGMSRLMLKGDSLILNEDGELFFHDKRGNRANVLLMDSAGKPTGNTLAADTRIPDPVHVEVVTPESTVKEVKAAPKPARATAAPKTKVSDTTQAPTPQTQTASEAPKAAPKSSEPVETLLEVDRGGESSRSDGVTGPGGLEIDTTPRG